MSRLSDILTEMMKDRCPLCGSNMANFANGTWSCTECTCDVTIGDESVRVEIAMFYHEHDYPIDIVLFLYCIHHLRRRIDEEFS